jgi:hypothetical protein
VLVCDAGYQRQVTCTWSDKGLRVRLAEKVRAPMQVQVTPICQK